MLAVAANVLTDQSHAGQLYQLTGPALMDFHEVAEVMSLALGHITTLSRRLRLFAMSWLNSSLHPGNSMPCVSSLEIAEWLSGDTSLQRRLICWERPPSRSRIFNGVSVSVSSNRVISQQELLQRVFLGRFLDENLKYDERRGQLPLKLSR